MIKTVLVSFLIFTGLAASAQPGSLDSSFGNNGLIVNDFGNDETIVASAVQEDGKIIFVGSDIVKGAHGKGNTCAISRYQPNGFPDSSFGKNGLIYIKVGNTGQTDWGSVALQKDGKMIIIGTVYTQYPDRYHFVMFRCTKEGTIDSTFGHKGFVQPPDDFYTSTSLFDIKVQPDGKIVAAGEIEILASGSLGTSMLVLRFTQNGKPDLSFGKNGRKIVSVGTYSVATALQILANGKILIGGFAPPPGNFGENIAAVQLTAAGELDASFGKKGEVITSIGEQSYATDLLLTGTGQFVTGGATVSGTDGNFALVRYEANGSIDSSFGTNGITTTDFGMYEDITRLALQPDGKIVAFGSSGVVNAEPGKYRSKFALARYKKNGKIDTGFGSNGIVTTDFGNKISQAYTGFIQSDGTIVAAGVTDSSVKSDNNDFALAGYKSEQKNLQLFYPITKVVLKN